MPVIVAKRTAVEDLLRKRDLLERYRTCWEHELEAADLKPKQRAAIESDISMIRAIDEDLLRLEQMLQGNTVPLAYNRVENEALREQIMAYLVDAGATVPTDELCAALDINETKLRNVMRMLRHANKVVVTRQGYRAITVIPVQEDAGNDSARRPQ